MIFVLKKKQREKPRYKKLLLARENVLNKQKILKLKKKKWNLFQIFYQKKLKFYKKFKVLDQKVYFVTKNAKKGLSYKKRYRDTLNAVRSFKVFYGSSKKHSFKKMIKLTLKNHKKYKTLNLNSLFLATIESRLDVILFRSGLCPTLNLARQIIKHKKVKVNNCIIKSKCYILKPGDLISFHQSIILKKLQQLYDIGLGANGWPLPPKHLYINYKTLQIFFGNPSDKTFLGSLTFNLKLEKILLNYLKTQ